MDIDKQIETLLSRIAKHYEQSIDDEDFKKILIRNALLNRCTKLGINQLLKD